MSESLSKRAALARAAARLAGELTSSGSLVQAFLEETLPRTRLARSLTALREAGLIEARGLAGATPEELAAITGVPSGASRHWARRLITLAHWADANSDRIESRQTEQLRDELRGLAGIGAALADRLLREGLGRAAYPMDRGTYRVLVRHGWLEPDAGYDEAREVAESLDDEQATAGRLRAVQGGLGLIARKYCRPKVADCGACPLREWLPIGGPLLYEEGGQAEEA